MTHYRLYFHDKGGHFLRASDVDVSTDDDARQCALDLDHAYCIEIWQGTRHVGLVQPHDLQRNQA
jgi:hypothetical protein